MLLVVDELLRDARPARERRPLDLDPGADHRPRGVKHRLALLPRAHAVVGAQVLGGGRQPATPSNVAPTFSTLSSCRSGSRSRIAERLVRSAESSARSSARSSGARSPI